MHHCTASDLIHEQRPLPHATLSVRLRNATLSLALLPDHCWLCDVMNALHELRCQLWQHVQCLHVFNDLLCPCGTSDDCADMWVLGTPCQRQLQDKAATGTCVRTQRACMRAALVGMCFERKVRMQGKKQHAAGRCACMPACIRAHQRRASESMRLHQLTRCSLQGTGAFSLTCASEQSNSFAMGASWSTASS